MYYLLFFKKIKLSQEFKNFKKLNEFQKVFQDDKRNFENNLENGIKEIINLETKMSTKIEQETMVYKI